MAHYRARRRCTAIVKRTGAKCGRYALQGAVVCNSHGARAPQVRRLAAIRAEVDRLGLQPLRGVDPGELLLRLIESSEQIVKALDEQVNELLDRAGGDWTRAFISTSKFTTSTGEIVDAGEHLRGLVTWWNQERDRLAGWSNLAVRAGLEERRVTISERNANQFQTMLKLLFKDSRLQLTSEQKAEFAPAIARVIEQHREQAS